MYHDPGPERWLPLRSRQDRHITHFILYFYEPCHNRQSGQAGAVPTARGSRDAAETQQRLGGRQPAGVFLTGALASQTRLAPRHPGSTSIRSGHRRGPAARIVGNPEQDPICLGAVSVDLPHHRRRPLRASRHRSLTAASQDRPDRSRAAESLACALPLSGLLMSFTFRRSESTGASPGRAWPGHNH